MSAARVDGASTREGGETAGGVPRLAGTQRYWVIAKDAKDGFGQLEPLTVDLDGTGEALPVFSFEEEEERRAEPIAQPATARRVAGFAFVLAKVWIVAEKGVRCRSEEA